MNNLRISFSNLIENIRAIHKAIILMSISLLLVVVLAQVPSDIATAQKDLEFVTRISSDENWKTDFILDAFLHIPDIALDRSAFYKSWSFVLDTETFNRVEEVKSDTYLFGVTAPIDTFVGWDYVQNFSHSGGATVFVDSPKNISEFASIWNRARNVEWMKTDRLLNPPYAYVQLAPGSPVKKVAVKIVDTSYQFSGKPSGYVGSFTPNIFENSEVESKDANIYGLSTTKQVGYGDAQYFKIWIPARAMPTPHMFTFDATEYLCHEMDFPEEKCYGPFEQVFPELYSLTQDFQNVSFEYALYRLEQEEQARSQYFEFLGLKLQVGVLNIIGSLILISLQIYFAIYIHTLSRIQILDEKYAAWIGILPNWFARSISVLTVTFIPLLSIYILNFIRPRELFSWISFPVLFISISIAVSVFVIFDFYRLWILIDTQRNTAQATSNNFKKNRKKLSYYYQRKNRNL